MLVKQVRGLGEASDPRLQNRRDLIASLLQQFASYSVIQVSPDRTAQMLK
jgi:hypothetical protein